MLQSEANRCFSPHVTLKFGRWPLKKVWHLFYVTSSFVHHFVAIGEFKLELQSGNVQFMSKSVTFLSSATLKFDRWPWKTIGHLSYSTPSVVHHLYSHWWIQTVVVVRKRPISVKISDFLSWVTLKSDRWPLKTIGTPFYATTVRKCSIWVKISNFFAPLTLEFEGWA